MPRAGQALRQKWQMEAAEAKLCSCGHRMGGHFELRDVLVPGTLSSDGLSFETLPRFERHPDHEVGAFHCEHEGCDCIVRR